jgi:hypothetical protein
MSTKLNVVTAAFALAVASLSGGGSALAECNGQWLRIHRGMMQCYFLPTVSGGRVTGLQEHMNIRRGAGAVIGGASPGSSSAPCRYLPSVVNGHLIGSRLVCG